jgi:hypothetical protein
VVDNLKKLAEARAGRLRINIQDSNHTIWLKISRFIDTIADDTDVVHCGEYDAVHC